MKNIRHISIALGLGLLLLSLNSCNNFEQVVNIDIPEHKPAISLSAEFGSLDTALVLSVGRSASILGSYEDLELDVTPEIKLFRNGELLIENFDCQGPFCSRSLDQVLGSAEDTYRLEISAPGWETVSSSQKMPPLPVIKDAEFIYEGTVDPEGYTANAWNVLIQDNPDQENYYRIDIYLNLWEVNDTDSTMYSISAYPSSIDPILSPIYSNQGAALICSDATFNGSAYWLRLYDYTVAEQNIHSVTFEVSSISKDGYLFYKSFSAYQDSQYNPFAEPVTVHENIENGHGIFILRNTAREEVPF